ncbi:pyrophosphate--fructose 6-phosphate 1-phosphotransferase [Thermogemmatispora aurantia]|uniref:Pyrophosphate--fructose 6-phosphate 1-phosphotransferase n=2 Tax=Thermogemmatispora aurantia TaxID=2045279 RepID=A0A5J4K8G1_9CHLR|nr:pyrophosphate--fructose 6-phosphate 1-phosphotransferase [Thermogemmatispora aurantia]
MTKMARANLLIGQSGGATAVINASLVGAVETALASERVANVYGMLHGIEGFLKEELIDLSRQPAELWPRLRETPSAALGTCRYRLRDEDLEHALALLRRYEIRYLLYIGGNDSADTLHRLALAAQDRGYELQAISIPKTIDNDLPLTDHCPGYGSAARFIALATLDSSLNTSSIPWHYPVKIIETMGRDAGWLAAASALLKEDESDPPHLILVPERPFRQSEFLARVEAIQRRLGYVVIVVAETVRDESGRPLGSLGALGVDAFGHPLLSGAAQYLVESVRSQLGLRARFDKPGDLQRMASAYVSPVDRAEALLVGRQAVLAVLAGESDQMITLQREEGPVYGCTTGLAPLASIANEKRCLPAEYLDESGTMITEAFRDYALPLLGELPPRYAQLAPIKVR